MDGLVTTNIRVQKTTWNEVESSIDVLANTLSRLTVECLVRYKTVSKLWCKVIKSFSFKKLQLSRSRVNPVYMIYPFMDVLTNLYLIDAGGKVIENVSLPGELEIRMCSPATSEVGLVPKGSLSGEELATGLAFGPTSEYKIFRFFRPKTETRDVDPECEIYSSSTRTWNGIGCVEHCPMVTCHLYVDGKVYWFVASEADNKIPGAIVSVDTEQNFGIIPLPEKVTERSFLVDFEGCLSLVAVYEYDSIVNIWVLNNVDNPWL